MLFLLYRFRELLKRRRIFLAWALSASTLLLGGVYSSAAWYDEGGLLLTVHGILDYGTTGLPTGQPEAPVNTTSQFATVGPVVNYAIVLAAKLLDSRSLLVARLVVALFSLSLLVLLARLVFVGYGRGAAIWAGLGLAFVSQFFNYGGQFLGEWPALLGLFLGIWALWQYARPRPTQIGIGQQLGWLLLSALALNASILCKAYFLGPIWVGLGFVGFCMLFVPGARWQGLVLLLVVATAPLGQWSWDIWRLGGLEATQAFWAERTAYGSEFWSFQWAESLPLLARKPWLWLGWLAGLVRLYFRRRLLDALLMGPFTAFGAMFLASSGFDRFLTWGIPFALIFLSEWAAFGWRWAGGQFRRYPRLLRVGIAGGYLLMLWQTGPWLLAQQLCHLATGQTNQAEVAVAQQLNQLELPQGARIFTYELQLVPFLSPDTPMCWPQYTPSLSELDPGLQNCPDIQVFVAGWYAQTEYPAISLPPGSQLLLQIPVDNDPEKTYRVYRLPSPQADIRSN